MRTLLLGSLICVLSLAAAGLAWAGPSFQGYSGLINIPTADSLDAGEYNLGAFATQVESDRDTTVVAADLGLLAGLEMGLAQEKVEGLEARTLVNGKYRFQDEGLIRPAMAIGAADLTDELDFSPYFVVSKSLAPPLRAFRREILNPRLHLGVGGGRFDGLFGGFSASVGKIATVMLEHDGHQINAGVRFALGPALQIHAAALDGLDHLGFGISYSKRL